MDSALWSSASELLQTLPAELGGDDPAGPCDGPARMLDYGAYFDLALVPPTLDEVPADARAHPCATRVL